MKAVLKLALAIAAAVFVGNAAVAETILAGEINLSQNVGMNVLVISNNNAAVSFSATSSRQSSDAEIVSLINQGGQLAVQAGDHDGDAKVQFVYNGDTYIYNIHCTTVELKKTVKAASETDANNKSNATIRIVSHLLKNKKPTPPNVLFFGTRCGAHTLTSAKLLTAINAIKDVGNIDWYTFGNSNEAVHDGNIKFGGADLTSIADMGDTEHGHHYALKAFYDRFDAIIADPALSNKYDFIVIETDGSRVANEYGTSARGGGNRVDATWSAQEERVATWLKPFYDKNKVIWIIDDGYDYDNYKKAFSGHDLDKLFSYGSDYDKPYRPSNVTMKNSGSTTFYAEILSDTQLKGLLGIFDPDSYFAFGASGEKLETYNNVDVRLNGQTTTTTTKAGTAIENQIFYEADKDDIKNGLQSMIHPVIYDIGLVDNVVKIDNSLVITNGGVRFYEWPYDVSKKTPTGADDPDWNEVNPCPVKVTGNKIENQVKNITNECYQMVQIDILVKDDFIAKAIDQGKAKFVPSSKPGEAPGYYEFDPNDGPAVADVSRGVEGEALVHCQTVAQTTMNRWNFQAIQATLETESAVKVYDGKATNITVKSVLPDLKEFGGKLEYSTDGGKYWEATNPQYTDVTGGAVPVWCRVTYTNPLVFGVTNNSATVTITPASLTVTPIEGQNACEGAKVYVDYNVEGFISPDSKKKNYVSGSYSLKSVELGNQAISDDGNWNFGSNYKVISSDPQGCTFNIKECTCVDLKCVYVYRVKLAGKTVKGRLLAGKTSCDETTCWAKPASLRIAGYIYGSSGDAEGTTCDPCSCNEWSDGAAMCHYWDENKHQVFADVTTFGFDLFEVLRNSGSMNKVQVFWTLGGLKLAGFGAFNPNTQTLKNASGFFAGALAAPTCSNWNAATCSEDDPTPAHVFAPCKLEEKQASAGAVSYGRWSLTYKADKARQAEEDDTWVCLYPTGWQPVK